MDIAKNKKARFEFEILEKLEAGIVLQGTEVKSVRSGKVNINDAFGKIKNGEVFIHQMHISPYEQGNRYNHETTQPRKLLLHKAEISKLAGKINEKGYTLVPLRLYFKKGKVKIEIGLGRGKTLYDKRQTLKKKDDQREMQRITKQFNTR